MLDILDKNISKCQSCNAHSVITELSKQIFTMGTQSKNKYLANAKRGYTCSLMFVAPEGSQARLRNKLNNKKLNNNGTTRTQPKLRPKKDKELSHKQNERLQQLFAIYAEQMSHNFRAGASNVGSLPKLSAKCDHIKIIEHSGGRNNNSALLPKLPISSDNNQSFNKKRLSRVSEVRFPSILE